MPSPAVVHLEATEWRALVDSMRLEPAADPGAYRHNKARLALAMLDAARCLHSFVRTLGQAAFEDAVADAVHGSGKNQGLLEDLCQAVPPIEYPKPWYLKCLGRRLIDAQRRLGRERAYISKHRDLEYTSSLSEVDPGTLPAEVQQTFADVANFAAVLLAVCDGLPSSHPFAQPAPATRKAWRDAVKKWSDTAGHLRRDNALGRQRLRWPDGVNGNDNHARAWQVRYYGSVGATEYFDKAELPQDKRSAEGALSYQHLGRFRKTYSECAGLGSSVVEHLANTPLQSHFPDSKRRVLPLAWEPARHHTLAGEDK